MANQSETDYDFEKLAHSYDTWYDSAVGQMYDRLEKRIFDSLVGNHNQGRQLLEIGCGTGRWSRYFVKKGFEVTGIDLSEEMIKTAQQKNIGHCHFQVNDGQSLSFFDNSFDAAAAITVLEFSKSPEKIISEMIRCVKPKGKLLLGVLNSLSIDNQKKQRDTTSVYAYGKLFSPQQLKYLLESYGTVKMHIGGFVFRNKWLIWLSPFWEFLCHAVHSQKGAFIAVEVQL